MFDYYLEIKNRLILLIFSGIFFFFTSYFYKEVLLFIFLKFTINFPKLNFYFISTNITEIFSAYCQLLIFLTNQILLLLFLYQFFIFMSPGLYFKEYKFLKFIFITYWCGVFLSILILYYLFLPLSFNFFLGFQNIHIHFEAKLNEYLKFYIFSYNFCFLNYQIFIILFIILNYIKIRLIRNKKFRNLFYTIFIFTSTIYTPPDISSQILCSLTLGFIYEFSLFISVYTLLLNKNFN